MCSDRMEGTEIESWTKSSELSKGGLKEGGKAWIATHTYALPMQRSTREVARGKKTSSIAHCFSIGLTC